MYHSSFSILNSTISCKDLMVAVQNKFNVYIYALCETLQSCLFGSAPFSNNQCSTSMDPYNAA